MIRYALCLLSVILVGCEEVALRSKNYPFLITQSVVVSETGAVLQAEVVDVGTAPVTSFGFLIDDGEPSRFTGFLPVDDKSFAAGTYSLAVNTGLEKGKVYKVKAYAQTADQLVLGDEISFQAQGSLAPRLVSFTPTAGPIGRRVELVIENLGAPGTLGSKVSVRFGDLPAAVDSIGNGRIYVEVPTVTTGGDFPITIAIAGMEDTSDDLFNIWFPWSRIKDFPGTFLFSVNSFVVGEKLYVIGGRNIYTSQNSNDVWVYDPATDSWLMKAPFPGTARHSAVAFSCAGKGYYGLGQYLVDFWEYDPVGDSWTQKANYPGPTAEGRASFAVQDKGYVAMGVSNVSGVGYLEEMWQYDPSLNQWSRKQDFPSQGRSPGVSSGNDSRGYLGMGFNGYLTPDFYEYNPASDAWVMMGEYPGSGRSLLGSCVIQQEIYVGLGMNYYFSPVNEFWRFDIVTKTWKTTHPCPTTMAPWVMQTIGNKAYLGYSYVDMYQSDAKGRIFYVFDPSKQ